MYHEADVCLLKQKRDSLVLIRGRQTQPGTFVIAGVSAEHPKCPENNSKMIRVKIQHSGWVLEQHPTKKNYAVVTYVTCIDFGGKFLPDMVKNKIASRMPLAIQKVAQHIGKGRTWPDPI